MGAEPEQLERDIERTRRELGDNMDALADRLNPRRAMGRQVNRTRGALGGLRDRVMGTASDTAGRRMESMRSGMDSATSSVESVGSAASSAVSSVSDTASGTVQAARRQAEGNPLAAGVIAFGFGWLVSSLLPPTEAEKQAATRVQEVAFSAQLDYARGVIQPAL
jgi:Protein of unknown function (DUF3618)